MVGIQTVCSLKQQSRWKCYLASQSVSLVTRLHHGPTLGPQEIVPFDSKMQTFVIFRKCWSHESVTVVELLQNSSCCLFWKALQAIDSQVLQKIDLVSITLATPLVDSNQNYIICLCCHNSPTHQNQSLVE